MFQLVCCVGGSLKNLCHFEMGGGEGGLANADVIRGGGGSLNADRGRGKICQNPADVICERSQTEHSFYLNSTQVSKLNSVFV